MNSSPLKIAIDAPVHYGSSGGVGQFVLGVLHALAQLENQGEEYVIVVESPDTIDWLRPFTAPNQTFVCKSRSLTESVRTIAKQILGSALPQVRRLRAAANSGAPRPMKLPSSNGFYEGLGCQVVHFPHQKFVSSTLPSIYNPHDLQHAHFPEFFTPAEVAWREKTYLAACREAHTVAVASEWVKNDCLQHFGLAPQKVQVIPPGPPTLAYAEPSRSNLETVAARYQLQPPFALYPAMTWPHKNHIRLLEALAALRDREGLIVRLVCTGTFYKPFWPQIERRLDELNLRSQVSFLGFLPEEDLRAIYRLCQFLVMPTLFESDSFPIYEAWLEGVPVTCSAITALPDQVGDAALLFDPLQVTAVADALRRLSTGEALRDQLRERGRQRVRIFDWEKTAKAYRALYRRAAGRPLSDEEHDLLGWDWMRQAKPARTNKPEEDRVLRVTRHFCTHFDRHYLSRGLVLHHSLSKYCPAFMLWILCLDADCHAALQKLNLPHVRLISLAELEAGDKELLAVKPHRSTVEYYFTCAPAFPWYLLQHEPDIDVLTHIDCDQYFFGDPTPVLQEMSGHSVAITPHRFPAQLTHMRRSGIYNVGWFSFRNDAAGLACLGWWRERCLEWCYDRWENNLYADQKYLDDWPSRFQRVLVLENQKVNLAPWNIANYILSRNPAGQLCADNQPLISFHFQRFRQISHCLFDTNLASYQVRPNSLILRELYAPYLRELRAVNSVLPAGIRYRGPRQKLRTLYKTSRSLVRGGCLLVVGDRVF